MEETKKKPPQHSCRLCSRTFPSGRALGGHMRSHVLNFSDSSEEETEFSSGNTDCLRSKLRRSSPSSSDDEHSSSVISDTTPEEHVARCLIMLSRDTRPAPAPAKDRGGRCICETCGKRFRSYQALGGHRASHIKQPASVKVNAAGRSGPMRPHACPFCRRVFSSGQALGGHKRSHFTAAASTEPVRVVAKPGSGIGDIDLNRPAPADDDDNSQIAVSALSEAEFVI